MRLIENYQHSVPDKRGRLYANASKARCRVVHSIDRSLWGIILVVRRIRGEEVGFEIRI